MVSSYKRIFKHRGKKREKLRNRDVDYVTGNC